MMLKSNQVKSSVLLVEIFRIFWHSLKQISERILIIKSKKHVNFCTLNRNDFFMIKNLRTRLAPKTKNFLAKE